MTIISAIVLGLAIWLSIIVINNFAQLSRLGKTPDGPEIGAAIAWATFWFFGKNLKLDLGQHEKKPLQDQ